MSEKTKEMLEIVNTLPETEQEYIREIIKKIILAWDPDFTKVTESEKKEMDLAEQELKNGEYVSHDEVWSFLDNDDNKKE